MKNIKESIRLNFSRSALTYDQEPDLHNQIIEQLLRRISGDYQRILDVGCGTGELLSRLAVKYPQAKLIGLDLAPGMVEQANKKVSQENIRFIVGDGEQLPFKNNEFDLVVSSSSLHWMDFTKVLAEAARVLKKGGTFCFATFGPATLNELRQDGWSVNSFPDKQDLERALAGLFVGQGISGELITKYYDEIKELFCFLKIIGAQNPLSSNNHNLGQRKRTLAGNNVRATFEVYSGAYQRKGD
ncbi:hypothetical protein A3H38_03565 [candidate division WOR-1 bacterium RIFCSPLOWO2_02_FULL_46_20]|uniref:Methyltransferase type 11 domain-containing protein n=2 Tax=Saganbacteria TaxID=1703751 RepID=A0A1F4RFZ2_UNCSA|nr:MAG: hypothetical protein A3J44_02915 [candidate division WOR-1 bacterium RIFCSPHIGHO2_02_FULL_45_12]OGC07105.1 MAG: hypothetical protein A3H38_03565 [candidate division WOR-1 bacterium RIFCSPLOWO2_02_FULL_46_20]OGC07973.1 MAG: hypothetical protein A3F86_05910 [candidate division WOR-1 bacterium RIFCSPLOWO2_12_FULL_45_9]